MLPRLQEEVHPHEWEQAKRFTHPRRKIEYLRSRWLFHQVSGNTCPLLSCESGACVWPPGYLGSLSHKEGHVALACGPDDTLKGVGVDIELEKKYPRRLEKTVLSYREIDLISDLAHTEHERNFFFLIIFSAKESLFKCLFPLTQRMFYFHDASVVSLDPERKEISFNVENRKITSHYLLCEEDGRNFILTTATLAETNVYGA